MNKCINALDIETFGKNQLTPYCCSMIINGIKTTAYGLDCVNKALEYAYRLKAPEITLFAHNLTFDGSIILSNMNKEWEISEKGTCLKGGSIYSLCLTKKKKTLILRCSSKIFPDDLESIAKKLDLPDKLKIDHSLVNMNNFNDKKLMSEVIQYCIRDVEIVTKFMTKIDQSLKNYLKHWISLSYSISGISLRLFKERFNNSRVSLELDFRTDEILREAYYGGRCEVFGNPEATEKIYHFDFTGMYTQRLTEEYPLGSGKFNEKVKNTNEYGFYSVSVDSNLNLPILPYRCKKSGKLIFPNGYFSGVYWKEELDLFVSNGGIIKEIFWSYTWKKKGRPFKEFADFCSKKRLDSKLNNILWKIIPNSFIGRIGIRPEYEKTIIIKDKDYDPRKLNVISDKKINNIWVVRLRDYSTKERVQGNVLYAAIVTSKARILWWKSASEVISKGGRLLYCDTDSIFAAYKTNVLGEKHGDIYWNPDKDDTEIKKACFACSKAYSIETRKGSITKIKGIPKKAIQMKYEEFEDLFYNNDKISLKIDLFRKKNYAIKIEEIEKITRFGGYDKRIFDQTKKHTSALVIKEDTLYNEKFRDYKI